MNWVVGLTVLVLAVALAAPMVLWRRRRAADRRDAAEVWLTGDPDATPADSDRPAAMKDGDDPSDVDGDSGDGGSDSGGSESGASGSGGSDGGGSASGGSDGGGSGGGGD